MKPHFIHDLELRPLDDGRNFRLVHGIGFWTPRTGLVSVPGGFVTDLASVPRIFWSILPPFGKYDDAAVIHDWLYRTHLFPRAVADATLLHGMKVKGVSFWARWTIWAAVRLFGGFAWRDDGRHIRLSHHTHFHA